MLRRDSPRLALPTAHSGSRQKVPSPSSSSSCSWRLLLRLVWEKRGESNEESNAGGVVGDSDDNGQDDDEEEEDLEDLDLEGEELGGEEL